MLSTQVSNATAFNKVKIEENSKYPNSYKHYNCTVEFNPEILINYKQYSAQDECFEQLLDSCLEQLKHQIISSYKEAENNVTRTN